MDSTLLDDDILPLNFSLQSFGRYFALKRRRKEVR
jgi:hypothetical protein